VIYNTTLNIKATNTAISIQVGKPFSLLKRIRLGGIGSGKMQIETTSENIRPFLNASHYPTYASIELRPNGILIHINQGLRNFCWPIPYYQLSIYRTEFITIYGSGSFIRFSSNQTKHFNFIKKILDEKIKWSTHLFNDIIR
jgi:hypothetical protein